MEATVNYLIQSGLALLVLYLFYRIALRTQPHLRYNRLYLLLAPVLALVIPLLRLPLPLEAVLPAAGTMPAFQLSEVQVTGYTGPSAASPQTLPVSQLLLVIYSATGFMLLARLIRQLVRIRQLAASGLPVQPGAPDATVLQTKGPLPAFAFLHYVFLGRQEHLSEKEKQQVLAHELAHVRLRHSYDILYYEVLTVVLWFNPLVWLLKEELRDVHEFQADAMVLSAYQPQEYSSLLAKEALYANGIPLGSFFQRPQVFRRLHMLQQHGRERSMLRPLLSFPLLLLLLVGFSAGKASADKAEALGEEPASLTELLVTAPARKAAVPIQPSESQGKETPENTAAPTSTPPVTAAETKQEPTWIEPAPVPANDVVSTAQKPYTYVEQMPVFKGGEGELLKYLGRNVRYPKEAQESGVEGLVVLTFVVATDGSLSDVSIVKSLHSTLDQEALRVVESMSGLWTPGRQNGVAVPVRYTLPVRFSIR